MRTSKPIASISFNSEPYLKGILDDMISNHVLSFYVYIKHNAEPDENADDVLGKDHIHVYMEPSHMTSTDEFRELFKEPDPHHDKPLGILPCRIVKNWADWYLYALHDPVYLAAKGKTRLNKYKREDFVTSDPDYLQQLIADIDWRSINIYQTMADYITKDKVFAEFMVSETVPVNIVHQFKKAYEVLREFYAEMDK